MDKTKIEALLELSRGTLDSYIKKTYKSGDKPYKRAEGRKVAQKKSMDKQADGKRWNEGVESLDEVKLISHYIGNGNNKSAKVYGKNEHGEHVVKHFVNGAHQKAADYFASDLSDAHGTAKHHVGPSHIIEKGTAKRLHDRLHTEEVDMKHIHEDGHGSLFQAILDGNREQANDIFDSVVSGRLDTLVADKKKELAATLFNQPEEQVEEELNLLGITEEFEPLELITEETHGQHHQIYSELTDRNKRLADAAANTYARGDINKDHKREVMRHFNLADKRLGSAKEGLGSAESADHLNAAAIHITDGGLHLNNVRTHTSLGMYPSY